MTQRSFFKLKFEDTNERQLVVVVLGSFMTDDPFHSLIMELPAETLAAFHRKSQQIVNYYNNKRGSIVE